MFSQFLTAKEIQDKENSSIKNEFSISYNIPSNNSLNLNYARKISENNWLKFGISASGFYNINKPINHTIFETSQVFFRTNF